MAGVDVEKVPNFEAFRTALTALEGEPTERIAQWIDKLEEWCKLSVEEREKVDKQVEELSDRIEAYERMDAENAAAQEKYDALVDKIEDYGRGIVTPDELIASVQ